MTWSTRKSILVYTSISQTSKTLSKLSSHHTYLGDRRRGCRVPGAARVLRVRRWRPPDIIRNGLRSWNFAVTVLIRLLLLLYSLRERDIVRRRILLEQLRRGHRNSRGTDHISLIPRQRVARSLPALASSSRDIPRSALASLRSVSARDTAVWIRDTGRSGSPRVFD